METNLVDGVIHGSYYEWYDFNKRKKRGNYVNGIANCLFLSWHYNGNQSTEMVFQDGHPVGISYFWNECPFHDSNDLQVEQEFVVLLCPKILRDFFSLSNDE